MVGTLGPGVGVGKAARFRYVATASQTTFSGADASAQALTLNYTPGYVEVAVDGIWLSPDEYTATNGSSIVFSPGLAVGRVVYAYALSVMSVANTYDKAQDGADIINKATFRANIGADFASGTVVPFWQAAAPTGWTKLTTQNDKALRVVSGTGGGAGGTNAFSTVMAQTVVGGTAISVAQMPSHQHTFQQGFRTATVSGNNSIPESADASVGVGASPATSLVGSGSTHNHTITMDVQYIDLILASKN